MNLSFICKMLVAAAVVSFTIAGSGQVPADCGLLGDKACCDSGCCDADSACCPKCKTCCKLDAEMVDVEKKCFEVECEEICIPRVVFPWQTGDCNCFGLFGGKKKSCGSCDACDGRGCDRCDNCVHNGARVRTVKVLKTKKYTCPECEYSWTPEKVPCTSCCDDKCCDTGGCLGGCLGKKKDCCDAPCCDSGCATAPCDAVTWDHQKPAYRDVQSGGMQNVEVEPRPAPLPQPAH